MHIDWFVFTAQILNFLLLVWLLKRFLYGRILKAMDEREAKIVQRYDEAEEIKKKAQEEAELYEEKNRQLNAMAEELMNKARTEAEAHKAALMSKAREEVDVIQRRWIETLAREQASFLEELRRRAGQQIFSIARKALTDLADEELEHRMLAAFLSRLEKIDGDELQNFKKTMGADTSGIIIQSAFDVPPDAREKINQTLSKYMNGKTPIQYDVSDDIVSGIEMRTSGHKISWSLNDYLVALEENFSHALQEASAGRA